MDIFRTGIYYMLLPFVTHILLIKVVNDSASDTSCWWKQRKFGTMIGIDYHNSCETPTAFKLKFRSGHFKRRSSRSVPDTWKQSNDGTRSEDLLSTRKTSTLKKGET